MIAGWRARHCAGIAAYLLAAGASADPYVYHDYASAVADLQALNAAFPELAELYTAQERFGLRADGDQGQYEQFILRITNEATGLDKPEVLLVGVQHGDEIVSVEVGIATARLLLEQYGRDPWLTALVDRREIYILPLANPDGFEKGIRSSPGSEPGNEDMNRDHIYDRDDCSFFCDDEISLSTIGARAVHELARRHLFRVMLDFHGGAELILHPWGSPLHTQNTESPDERAAAELGLRMSSFGGPYSGFYPVGTANDLLGPAHGPLDDTAYAASWDAANADPLQPSDGWRAVAYTVEISNQKSPPQSALGGDLDLLTPGGAEDGFVPKNIRIALAAIDIAEPWIEWTNRAELPVEVSVGETLPVEWQVRGCFEVNDTHLRWGNDPDPRTSFTDASSAQQDLGANACFETPTAFSASVSFPAPGTYFLTPVARVDESLLLQGNPTPGLAPQSWLVRARSEEGLLFTNATDPDEINTVQAQQFRGASPLQITVTAAGGYTLSDPAPGQAGIANTWTITGATAGVRSTLAGGLQDGATPVPGCPGLNLAIGGLRVLGNASADSSGVALLQRQMPGALAGRTVFFQAVELATCTVSNRITFSFP